MGMFDDLKCEYPLPLAGANDLNYQTKDTNAQYLDRYEIRADGTLWHEEYETEDRSKLGQWVEAHPGQETPEELKGFGALSGLMSSVNKRWVQEQITGEICFYTTLGEKHTGWIEWSAYFVAGKLKELHLISHVLPDEK
jgi:hypothetical protein